MSSRTPSRSPSIRSDTPVDLETVFKDSAGLRIARFIVGEYLKADKQRSAGNITPSLTQDTFCSVSPLRFDSSPEFRRMLEERLVFRETESVTSDPEHLRRDGFPQTSSHGCEISRESYLAPSAKTQRNHQQTNLFAKAPAQTSTHPSYSQHPRYNSSLGISSTQVSSLSRPQFRPTKSQVGLEIDGLFDEQNSQTLGTESPYKVESPSGRTSGISSSQHSPQRGSDKDSFAAYLPSLDQDPLHLDRILFSNSPPLSHTTQSSAPGQNYLSDSGYFSQAQSPSASMRHSRQLNDNISDHTGLPTFRTSPTIKSFLPVNKTTDNNDPSHLLKHSGFSYSLLSHGASVSQSRLASGHSSGPNSDNIAEHHNTAQSTFTPTHNHPHRQPPPSPSAKPSEFDFEQLPQALENQEFEMEHTTSDSASKKRKAKNDGAPRPKKLKTGKADKPKRVPKVKEQKPEPAKYRLGQDLWMRILEFTPPSFLKKARVLSKEFKGWVDNFNSIYVNQRKENYGQDMPPPPRGLTERQYNDLLGGKGCLEPGCTDKLASRTHWSWAQRWCWDCWKAKIEREDRVIKQNQSPHGRNLISKLLECIPVGMHDSFLKPHDFIEDLESRPRGAPRLYRYYLKEDVKGIIARYDALTPPPYKENPAHSVEERARAQAAWQEQMDKLDETKADFLAKEKEKNDAYMKTVQKIESLVKKRRDLVAKPYNDNRKARRDLFTKRAREDLPHIPTSFVESTKAFKAATRIFRDGGTERGWQTLKPKIEKEYEESKGTGHASIEMDEDEASDREDNNNGTHNPTQMDVGRANLQNAAGMSMLNLRQQQQRQRQFNVHQQMLAQRELMLSSSSMSSGMSSSIPSGMGFGTISQAHQHQHSFVGGVARTPSLYDSFGATLFPRQLLHRSGPPSNFNSYAAFTSMSQSSSAHNSSNSYQSLGAQQPSRIPISSLLGPPPTPSKAPNFDPFA